MQQIKTFFIECFIKYSPWCPRVPILPPLQKEEKQITFLRVEIDLGSFWFPVARKNAGVHQPPQTLKPLHRMGLPA